MLNTATTTPRVVYPGNFYIGSMSHTPGEITPIDVSAHNVTKIEVSAESGKDDAGKIHHWQTFIFYGEGGVYLGQVTAYLVSDNAALQVGSMPPYFGIETAGENEWGDPPF